MGKQPLHPYPMTLGRLISLGSVAILLGVGAIAFASARDEGPALGPRVGGSQIVFITGNPVDIQASDVYRTLDLLKEFVASEHPADHLVIAHNSRWRRVCRELVNLKAQDPATRILLLGHSFGAEAAVDVARCLEGHQVEVNLLVTIDSIHRWFHKPGNVIPENVAWNFSYFQTDDWCFRGYPNNRRSSGSQAGIINIPVEMPSGGGPAHWRIPLVLFQSGELSRLISEHAG